MYKRKGFPTSLGAVVAIVLVVAAQAGAVPVTMAPYDITGQTRVFRGDLSGLGVGTLHAAMITDKGIFGGETGVFSGCDVDFLLLDVDGNLATTGDQILPFQTVATFVTPGSVRNAGTSPYQPTTLHPGNLFGLKADGSADFATSTIGVCDASYLAFSLTVNGSSGWVTLGDNGSLTADFPDTTIGQSLWLFVGEAGLANQGSTEGLSAWVDVAGVPNVPAPGAMFLVGLGAILVRDLRRRQVL